MDNPYMALRTKGALDVARYEERVIETIQRQVGTSRVLLGLSGGVDSSVCAALLAKAIPGKLHCIFVDHGLLRKNESSKIMEAFKGFDLNLICVDAADRFLTKLAGVIDPEEKRKIIGEEFNRVFEEEGGKLQGIEYLAQGTIYPDVLESGVEGLNIVKSHNNVGGLPEDMGFKGLVEPLRGLYKIEVRFLARHLGLPPALTERQSFPGPGLAVRCIGEITKEKLDILREADAIFCSEIENAGVCPAQYFAILTDISSVGVTAGERTYGHLVALRAVSSADFMTASYVRLSHQLLNRISQRITAEIPTVNRVVYDITDKPPSTVEWE